MEENQRSRFALDDLVDCDTESELELTRWYLTKKEKNLLSSCTSNQRNTFLQLKDSALVSSVSSLTTGPLITNVHVNKDLNLVDDTPLQNENKRIEWTYDTSSSRFLCPLCDRSFLTRCTAQAHYDSIHLHKVYPCSQCSQVFINQRRRRRHFLRYHQRFKTLIPCPVQDCGRSFSNPVELLDHKYSAHHSKETKHHCCHLCGMDFAFRKSSLEKHMLQKHSPRTEDGIFHCLQESCSWSSRSYSCLRRHIRFHQESAPHFACDRPDCEKKFFSFADLARHRHADHQNSNLTCALCSRVFVTFKRFQKHLTEKHPPGSTQSLQSGHSVYFCPITSCGKVLSSSRNIREHIIHAHLMLKSYRCHLCSSLFTSSNAARHHVKVLHKNLQGDSDIETHIATVYNMPWLNSEEAVRRICTAFERHAVPPDFLKPGGIGLQSQRPEVVETLKRIADDATFGCLRKKRKKPQRKNSSPIIQTEVNALHLYSSESDPSSCETSIISQKTYETPQHSREKISLTVEGDISSVFMKHTCLHRKTRHLAKTVDRKNKTEKLTTL